MLSHLSIKNLALLEDNFLEFGPGLTVLTGETGSGKSIVLDALGLALGAKADAGLLRQGAPRLTVTAGFRLSTGSLRRAVAALGVDDAGEDLVLRREVDAAGKSRAFVNDHPVAVGTLARLSDLLVEVHGQNEHQRLLRPAEQRDLLDAYGELDEERAAVARAFEAWRDLSAERDALSLSEQERAQRLDLLRFQKQELDAAGVKADEEESLERLLPQLKNAERLQSLAGEAHGLLYSQDASALDLVRRVQRDVESLRTLGADLAGVPESLEEAVVRLEDVSRRLDAVRNGVESDPARLEEILSRMDLLARLKKKYGPTLADVAARHGAVAEELERLENLEGRRHDMDEKVAGALAELVKLGAVLTKGRRAAATKLSAAVRREFRELGLAQAEFAIEVTPSDERRSASGADLIQFLFEPNPGEGRQPLAAVASGGELSRVMLALKTVLAKADAVPVLLFDEVDAGVGGNTAGVLGRKLAKLGQTHQVISVTHLAAVAACADTHVRVEKEIRADRTRTLVRTLSDDERVEEIARLFGGVGGASDQTIGLRHARELLKTARG
jgi:DNA repair protein RecN (Recombination protein N)